MLLVIFCVILLIMEASPLQMQTLHAIHEGTSCSGDTRPSKALGEVKAHHNALDHIMGLEIEDVRIKHSHQKTDMCSKK